MNECSNCFFCRVTTPSPHLRPKLTCRAALPSVAEEYVWPVVPGEGWCVNYKQAYPDKVATETEAAILEVEAMLEVEIAAAPVKPRGKKA
jgi:hypothetical protein